MGSLEVENLVVHYGKINALKGVSLEIGSGDFVTLIGANGAGKTTLLNSISGVIDPTAGSIRYKGQELLQRRTQDVVRLGVVHVPEGRKIFSELTVEENLQVGAYLVKEPQKIRELLERSYQLFPALADRRRQEGGTLSGGEQQMLALARGLMCDPELLLLDEPSLGIAPILVERLFEFIVKINAMGKSILLVEQNAYLALQVARYGYVLETGKIVREGLCTELCSDDGIRRSYLGVN